MTITYAYKRGLYLNITNLCTNRCSFCIRNNGDSVYGSSSLRLEREPTRDEIIAALEQSDHSNFDELVFCGYGEPTCRLYDMLMVCRYVREHSAIKIRLNTNGHASLIMGEDTTPLFEGLFDIVSISLNAADSDTYLKICRPKFGESAYAGVLKFARDVSKYVPRVILSVVKGTIPDNQIPKCAAVAEALHVDFRAREYEE